MTLKHYAYYNMSRRTQLTTKYMFSVMSQLSENFIFIYLGLTLLTKNLYFKPFFIIMAIIGICAARWAAVFPLSKAINFFIRYKAKRRGNEVTDELPYQYQVMLFWAGLRGAVGVALAEGLTGKNGPALQATVLVVVVLTVIIFGGTTARMLEIMGIRTGVVEEIDSDDEFDIETATNGTYYKSTGNGVGYKPRRKSSRGPRDDRRPDGLDGESYSSGTPSVSPPERPISRTNSRNGQRERDAQQARQSLLDRGESTPSDAEDYSDSDLPPAARRPPKSRTSPSDHPTTGTTSHASSGAPQPSAGEALTATGAISQLFGGTADEQAAWFTQIDEGFIKPKLLLDQNQKGGGV